MSEMTPREIVQELDKHIIGQVRAKHAVANALRYRWRRMNVPDEQLRQEITPKNILMIGPTGVGKTEIARRLAKLANAPFIKVEVSKFTEVGYVGREVDSIIRDLLDIAIKSIRERKLEMVRPNAQTGAEEKVLDALLPPPPAPPPRRPALKQKDFDGPTDFERDLSDATFINRTREKLRAKLREGVLDEKLIEIDVKSSVGVEIMGPSGFEEMTGQLQSMMESMANRGSRTRKVTVKQAMRLITDEEAHSMVDEEEIKLEALGSVEQNGIVFLDEFDKIVGSSHSSGGQGPDVSREGVQRDLLPLIEGSTVSTRHGMVNTDHILFIASGAFQMSKPADLIPEIQGRLPIRVELNALTAEDFVRILTDTDYSLTMQYSELMKTEEVTVEFDQSGVDLIAEMAWKVNETTENIGARRLHTVMERLLEGISFEAADRSGDTILIDSKFVEDELNDLVVDQELSRYIL